MRSLVKLLVKSLLAACLITTVACGGDPVVSLPSGGEGAVDVSPEIDAPAEVLEEVPPETTGEVAPEIVTPPDVVEVAPDVEDDTDALGEVADLPDDGFIPSDGACEPTCEDKACGSDGCGGICGYCTYPLICNGDGVCVEVCQPQCDLKTCGPDGCGGLCDPGCDESLSCADDGLCYEPTCEPNCTDKVCGSDGCGGDCGLCATPKVCLNGGCALGPCGTVDATGECQGELLVLCEDLVNLVQEDCDEYDDKACGYDSWANVYACVEIGPCTPQCDGKVCGADGCEGSCGACTGGWACELGQCKPEPGGDCGPISAVGTCEGDVLIFCSAAKIYMEDCAINGETCKWDPPASTYGCL
jgi:hypothetical protein